MKTWRVMPHLVLTLRAWVRRCSCRVNLLPHMGQGKGLSPVWQRMCLFMIPFCLAVYGQKGHLWSFTGTTKQSPKGGERQQLNISWSPALDFSVFNLGHKWCLMLFQLTHWQVSLTEIITCVLSEPIRLDLHDRWANKGQTFIHSATSCAAAQSLGEALSCSVP